MDDYRAIIYQKIKLKKNLEESFVERNKSRTFAAK